MAASQAKNSKWLTGVILTLSIAGVVYFGFMAISDDSTRNQDNPFEYDIAHFKQTDPGLMHYREIRQINLAARLVGGIAIDKSDNIFVTADSSVMVYAPDGAIRNTISTNGTATCLTVNESGQIFLGMGDHVEVYHTEGTRTAKWQTPQEEALLTSLVVIASDIFVADAGNLIIWKYDHSGDLLGRIGDRDPSRDIPGFIIPSPYFDVAVDSDGFLWAVNTGRHSVENYALDGAIRTAWGHASMELDGFAGCCNPVHIATLSNGSFVTSEKGIVRIKIYNELGELSSIVASPDQFHDDTDAIDLAVDSSDRIYALDPRKKAIRIFDKSQTGDN